jgi:phosphoserine phosphatase RsbU/P
MSILIVEDNSVNAKLLEANLRNHGYEPIVAGTGQEALDCLSARQDIQLVITDIMMPEMDGLELLHRMKTQPAWQAIPVMLATALADVETVRVAARLGCRHYLVKPIKAAQLLEKVQEALDQQRPVLRDQVQMQIASGLDLDAYQAMAGAFRALVHEQIAQVGQPLEAGTAAELPPALLELSEGAALLGAERLLNLLERIRLQHAQEQDPTPLADMTVLLRELQLVHEALILPHASAAAPSPHTTRPLTPSVVDAAGIGGEPNQRSQRPKILIAEDELIARRQLEMALVKWGYPIVVASDGAQAWQMLQEDDAPPVAILDWMMPNMDGIEICRKVRQLPPLSSMYLILLTAKGRRQDIVIGLEAGADAYLIKPFHSDELRARVQAGLRRIAIQRRLTDQVSALQRLLPLCAACQKIRDDQSYQQQVARYIAEHMPEDSSFPLCPHCEAHGG